MYLVAGRICSSGVDALALSNLAMHMSHYLQTRQGPGLRSIMKVRCGHCGFLALSDEQFQDHLKAQAWLASPTRCRYSKCFEAAMHGVPVHYCSALGRNTSACPLDCQYRQPLQYDDRAVQEMVATIVRRATTACDISTTLHSDRITSLDGAFTWSMWCGQDPYEVAPALLETARKRMRDQELGLG